MTNFSCSGISPGKSPFGALTRFPLQPGQEVEAAAQKYFLCRVPIRVSRLPNLSCSGSSPGKSPFGALTRFPLQSGQKADASIGSFEHRK